MKIHLPIVLRKALLAVFAVGVTAAMATPSAMAAENVEITDPQTDPDGLTMDGTVSNKIINDSFSTPTNVTVTAGDITMTTVGGYNAILGFTGTSKGSNVKAEAGNILMDGPANVVAFGSTVIGQQITLKNSGKQTIAVGTVAEGILGAFAGSYVPDSLSKIEGSFNIVQDSTLGDTNTTLVSMDSATANLIAGGSAVKSGDINMTGGANVVVDTTLENLMGYVFSKDLASLLAGKAGISTTLTAGNDINLGAKLNLVHGGQSVVLDAGNAVNLTGAINVLAGNTTVNGVDINLTPGQKTYITADELAKYLPERFVTLAEQSGIAAKLAKGVNASVVAGGAKLDATNNITTSGTVSAFVNTRTEAVVDALQTIRGNSNASELQLVCDLLSDGMATTIEADNNIAMGSRLNLVHGGAIGDDSKMLTITAGKEMSMEGTFNVVSGNVKVNAKDIRLEGTSKIALNWDAVMPEQFAPMADQLGITDKLSSGINGNMVMGGAILEATNDITLDSMVNAVFDTELVDIVETVMTKDLSPLIAGGAHETTLTSGNNINLLGRLNMLSGGKVTVSAGNALNIEGTINVISGRADVSAKDINLVGKDNVGLDFVALMPGSMGSLAEQMGLTTKLDKGVNANVIAGGALVNATHDINTSGMAGVLLNTPMSDAFGALMTMVGDSNASELELLCGVLQAGEATTVKAGNDINLGSRLNLLHGGAIGNEKAALTLTAGNAVNMAGTFNVVSGNVIVKAKDINLTGRQNMSIDLTPVISKVFGAGVAEMAQNSGMIDKLKTKGINANVVTGGAVLDAEGDITMSGMANAVIDTELVDVVEAVKTGKMDSLIEGGAHVTTLNAKNNINLQGRLNVVNGGKVALYAGNAVNVEGTLNVISGNSIVQGTDINIASKDSVGLDWGALVPDKYAAYGELAKQMGIIDKLNSGVNGSIIAGGTELYAKNDITTTGMATAVVDTTLGNVLDTLLNKNLGPIIQGGSDTTSLKADHDINLQSRLNLVSGGKVALEAGNAVNMTGTFNVVSGNTTVNANDINLTAKNKVGVDISPMLNGHYAELAEEMGMTDIFKNGVSSNIVSGGAALTAKNDVVMSGVATAVVDTSLGNLVEAIKDQDPGKLMQGGGDATTVTAARDIKLESQINVVNGGNTANAGGVVLDAGRDVSMSGQISVVNRATVKAGENVNFASDLSVLKNSELSAQTVSFTGKNAEMTNVKFGDAAVNVLGTTLENTADSKVAINGPVLVADEGSIENYGSLTLEDAAVVNSTIFSDSADTTVNGALTLQSATLVFTSDSLTLNDTGIDLSFTGDALNVKELSTFSTADAVAGVNFLLSSELLEKSTDGAFELILFENATSADYDKMFAAIQADEVSITLRDLNSNAIVSDVAVEYVNNNIVVTGKASIPEPTTATLSLLALAALAARRRRK